MRQSVIVTFTVIALVSVCGIASLSSTFYFQKTLRAPIPAKIKSASLKSSISSSESSPGSVIIKSTFNNRGFINSSALSSGIKVIDTKNVGNRHHDTKPEQTASRSAARSGPVSLFGLHGIKVMPSCSESDGTFLPPLVSI
jgi:hypothetical protein